MAVSRKWIYNYNISKIWEEAKVLKTLKIEDLKIEAFVFMDIET